MAGGKTGAVLFFICNLYFMFMFLYRIGIEEIFFSLVLIIVYLCNLSKHWTSYTGQP